MKRNLGRSLLIITVLECITFSSAAEEMLRVHYNERPPYLETVAPGIAVGLTATPATRAFQNTGIPHLWVKTPSKRQMEILKQNRGKDCLVGWFKKPEREVFAKYTRAIYQDKPTIAIALANNRKTNSLKSIKNFFANQNLKLLVKSGYSYGKFIDSRIDTLNPKRQTVTTENANMLQMIMAARADYMFASEEEADGMIETVGLSKNDFKYIRFTDTPAGNKRYILCSMKVENRIIEKLNTWIKHNVNISD